MRFILASASPRRKEILARILSDFEVIPSEEDEAIPPDVSTQKAVELLAIKKAESVAARNPDACVLGADTVVSFEGKKLGKPKDPDDAVRTLTMLSGRLHDVFTGWCIVNGANRISGTERSSVRFRCLDEEFIHGYVASGSPMDKAGSYGIQDDPRLVAEYSGSFTNIMGLPEEKIREILKEIRIIK